MPSVRWLSVTTLIVLLASGGYLFFKNRSQASYQFVTVTQGPITETVSMTGNTTPMQNVSLAFQSEGTIAQTNFKLGDQVHKGDIIAKLNTANLSAALAQARADVDTQEAQLEGLLAGAQPEDISVSQTSLASAKANLEQTKKEQSVLVANAYRTLLSSNIVAEPITNTSSLSAPLISGTYNKTDTGTMTISIYGAQSTGYFSVTGLNENISGILPTTVVSNPYPLAPVAIGDTGLYLQLPSPGQSSTVVNSSSGFVVSTSGVGIVQSNSINGNASNNYDGTTWSITIPNTTSPSYTQNYSAYQAALQTQAQAIAAAQAQVDQAQAGLKLKQAGSTSQSIAAQNARLSQAKATVANALANLENATIVAPIDGTITQQDAKIGEQASPNVPLVSIIGSGGFEVDAGVSEKDIGKLQVGNAVTMTLDAFPNETFNGTIFYIAPTQTDTQGVITYLTKISFNTPDPRLKSGLTANLNIETKKEDSALVLPGNAILQNDNGTFVEVLNGTDIQRVPVTLGIQDLNGNVEILSGVTAGEKVLNIGYKGK